MHFLHARAPIQSCRFINFKVFVFSKIYSTAAAAAAAACHAHAQQVAHAKAAVSSMKTDFGGASGSSSDPTDAFMKSLKMEDYDNEDDGACAQWSCLYCSSFQNCWSTMEN